MKVTHTVLTLISMFFLLGSTLTSRASQTGLDPSLDGDGRISTDFPGTTSSEQGTSIALQADNKFIIAGVYTDPGNLAFSAPQIGMARYNADGSLDTTFNDGSSTPGSIIFNFGTDLAPALVADCVTPSPSLKNTVALQSSGHIVVGCTVRINVNGSGKSRVGVARFNAADGTNDTTFNNGDGFIIGPNGGDASIMNDNTCYGMAIQPDDKIVTVGRVNAPRIYLVRFNADGTLDTGFGGGSNDPGTRATVIGTCCAARGVAIQNDGKIVVTGFTNNALFVARYTAGGVLDSTTFNAGGAQPGVTTTRMSNSSVDAAEAVALQNDGKIVVAGRSTDGGITQFVLARYNNDGTIDTDFGTNGIVLTTINNLNDQAWSVIIQPNGKIIAGGLSKPSADATDFQFALVRYLSDGTLDPDFGDAGIITTSFSSGAIGQSVVLQPHDKKILLAGYAQAGTAANIFAAARYQADYSTFVTVTSLLDGTIITNPVPTITGTTEIGATVEIIVDGVSLGFATVDGSGNWTFIMPAPLIRGDHAVEIRATDSFGNTATAQIAFTLNSCTDTNDALTLAIRNKYGA